jgi:hypothetical protein
MAAKPLILIGVPYFTPGEGSPGLGPALRGISPGDGFTYFYFEDGTLTIMTTNEVGVRMTSVAANTEVEIDFSASPRLWRDFSLVQLPSEKLFIFLK